MEEWGRSRASVMVQVLTCRLDCETGVVFRGVLAVRVGKSFAN